MAKRLMVAYVLWAVGGPLGLHHIYLGRDSHALLWILTFGGFGMGWARELFRIPSYVGEANQEVEGVRKRPPRANPPPGSPTRFAGQVCVGIYFGMVALISLSSLSFFHLIVLPLCVGAGVHLVSCVGQETSNFPKTLTASVITSSIFYGSTLSPLPVSLAASVTATQHRTLKRPRPPAAPSKTLGSRLCHLGVAWLAFSAPLAYCVFHNTTATLYYLSDCVAALLDMFWFFPWLRGALEYFLLLPYRILVAVTGGSRIGDDWKKVLEILLRDYSQREKEAFQVLSVSEGASLQEITHSYRDLVKVWHPDHNPSLEAQQMFIKIQEAYETLLRQHRPNRKK